MEWAEGAQGQVSGKAGNGEKNDARSAPARVARLDRSRRSLHHRTWHRRAGVRCDGDEGGDELGGSRPARRKAAHS